METSKDKRTIPSQFIPLHINLVLSNIGRLMFLLFLQNPSRICGPSFTWSGGDYTDRAVVQTLLLPSEKDTVRTNTVSKELLGLQRLLLGLRWGTEGRGGGKTVNKTTKIYYFDTCCEKLIRNLHNFLVSYSFPVNFSRLMSNMAQNPQMTAWWISNLSIFNFH